MRLRNNRGQLTRREAAMRAASESLYRHVLDLRAAWERAETEWRNQYEGFEFESFRVENGEVVDQYGNYLFGLPRTEPANFSAWLENALDTYFGVGE